jgi:DNA-binding NtrC family response regulator
MAKILIVDDREDYLRALTSALRRDFEVKVAKSLQEAIANMDASVDVALVDVRLSEEDDQNRDGVRFLEWVKKNFPRVPTLMMSAYRDFDAAVEALNLGAAHFLKKPIDLRGLKELLRSFVEHYHPESETQQNRQ